MTIERGAKIHVNMRAIGFPRRKSLFLKKMRKKMKKKMRKSW
jgi:hypothetical protein